MIIFFQVMINKGLFSGIILNPICMMVLPIIKMINMSKLRDLLTSKSLSLIPQYYVSLTNHDSQQPMINPKGLIIRQPDNMIVTQVVVPSLGTEVYGK